MGVYPTVKHNSLWLDSVGLSVCLNRLGVWKSVLNWVGESWSVMLRGWEDLPKQSWNARGLGKAVKPRFQRTLGRE